MRVRATAARNGPRGPRGRAFERSGGGRIGSTSLVGILTRWRGRGPRGAAAARSLGGSSGA
eukprot:2201559-Pyramimonas_sp.AAC.1